MKQVFDLIIIGGGPAGIAAGIYTARQKLNVLLISKSFGGQMTRKAVEIENYPGFQNISGLDLIQKFEKHLKKQDINIINDSISKVKKTSKGFSVLTFSKKQFESISVIIASGADPRPLEVSGEKKFIGKGVSYCVTCDGPLYNGKNVVVIGGGNAGFEAALSLASYAEKIYILEYGLKVMADEENQNMVKKNAKIEIITQASLKKIQGKDFVESIVYQDRKLKKLMTLSVQGVFVEIGSQPATSFIKGLVEFNQADEIKIDSNNCTKTPGLFAAGDATEVKYKQIVIAAGEGAKAALSAAEYLKKNA